MSDVARILSQIESGDRLAAEQLLPLVYDELRRIAAGQIAREQPGQTLQATALVHEAYVRLVDQKIPQSWDNRRHFFAAAAEAMRRILVERARRKQSVRHGGGRRHEDSQSTLSLACEEHPADLLDVNAALARLAAESPGRAELVKLRFFAGLTMSDAADVLGISLATAERQWVYARTWLFVALRESADDVDSSEKSRPN